MLWNEKYETGNTVVDEQHKEIFHLVQRVIDANFESRHEKVNEILNFLAEYTVQHFLDEEKIMLESGYPNFNEHKKQHTDFLEKVTKLIKTVSGSTDSIENSIVLNKVIVDWLSNHVLGSDMSIAEHYRKWLGEKN